MEEEDVNKHTRVQFRTNMHICLGGGGVPSMLVVVKNMSY